MRHSFAVYSLLMAFGALVATGCTSARQETFESPNDAAMALVQAVREGSRDRVKQILGPEGEEIVFSGDDVADRTSAETFARAYDEKHQLMTEPDGRVTLVVGANDWPLPIPIVMADGHSSAWRFDTEAGKDEIINRRIGQNELDVIEVCKAIADAQQEYALKDLDGDGVREYAQKFLSDPGTKNGLYWPTGEGEALSPLGVLVADAVEEGYTAPTAPSAHPHPYHGYCYKILKSQGASAPGGAMSYTVNGKMIGGFAVVAYPIEYGNSGIMTFLTNYRGVVYQKDLGDDTANVAKGIESFDPSQDWAVISATTAATLP